MRLSFKHTATALAVGLSVALVGCGADKSAETTSAKSAGATTTKNTLTINNGAEISSLDPHKTGGVPESGVARQQFVGLTTTDADGNLEAGIAKSWESKDNIVWTFQLRDAKWSNGEPITAQDFVFSFQRMVDPKTAANFANYVVDAKFLNASDIIEGKKAPSELGVKAIDDKTLEITLSEAVPFLPEMLTYTAMRVVPQKAVEQFGDTWAKPENIVVNGPYIIKEWKVGEKMVFVKNPHYYDADKVAIDNLVLLPIDSGQADLARYQAGELDITYTDIPSEMLATIKTDEVKTSPSFCSYYYEMNVNKAPFDDVRVRRAMTLALDRDIITQKVAGRGETPAYQMTPIVTATNPNYTPQWQAWDKAKRIEEAKRLLNEAGYNEQNPLKFELLYNTSENHKKVAVAAQSLWQEALGFVQITLSNQEWKAYLASRRNHEHQMARAAWCGDYNDPATFLNVMRTEGSGNYGDYSSKEYDTLLKTALTTKTAEERAKVYHQLEGILDKDTPNVWVYYQVNARVVKPDVQGYSTKDALGNWQARHWSFK
ncbi:ABC transporter substrate-binding protein [Moraxella oblonga]|uniref:ABC transporter substrate-binding protein n=1 Tax=Moraxella oblonga TaxID=200413 RepID=UPI00082E4BC1|nr:ABC transporter substrate-binding protein [Moraxella oblonga]